MVRLPAADGPALSALLTALYTRRLTLSSENVDAFLSLALFLEAGDITDCCCSVSQQRFQPVCLSCIKFLLPKSLRNAVC